MIQTTFLNFQFVLIKFEFERIYCDGKGGLYYFDT